MEKPLQITFRGMEPSEFVEARARELAERLERFEDRITSCHVTVEAPHQHQHQGHLYDVRLRIRVPGGEIIVSHDGSRDHAHEDVYVALRDAFDAAVRRLEDRARKLDHRAHKRDVPTRGRTPGARTERPE